MDSAHHQHTVHIHIGHDPCIYVPCRTSPTSPKLPAQRNQAFTWRPRRLKHFDVIKLPRLRVPSWHPRCTNVLLRPWQNTKKPFFSSISLQQRQQKPLSVSALGIPRASFFSLQQRQQKPLSASALGIPRALFFSAPAALSKSHFLQVHRASSMHCSSPLQQHCQKATFRKCTAHPACIVLLRFSSVVEKPLSASAPRIQYALFSLASVAS
jgi:hypothetical protein